MNSKLYCLLLEYLKDSSRSDRELAKILGVSHPTVSRMRAKLISDGVISHFSAIPDLTKIGYEILAFSFVKFNMNNLANVEKSTKYWLNRNPQIIFSARCEGLGMDAVTLSLHRNYAEYKKFFSKNRFEGSGFVSEAYFVLVDIKSGIAKPFSFEYLAENKKQKTN
ncbi:MAG: Lrp/AsnC family transcriptional regulator [Candidatus Bathyarchaeota archaeon]|nr:Lrp/AsnC family transcriptional regulator [Candidatus Bathyarchaeum tardum]WGM89444.1 MAG: Lrp/AsnC family transcriptional regulator [Candidatus Bathyarchaeum tardum]